MKRTSRLLLLLLLALTPAAARAGEVAGIRPLIANGLPAVAWPEVGMLFTATGNCTATAIGCRTALTAAHCVCDAGAAGAACGDGTNLILPTEAVLFLPQAGYFGLEAIEIAIDYEFGVAGDIAVLTLTNPLRGVRPSPINHLKRPPTGTLATIVGYGATQDGVPDGGLKRYGAVTTSNCAEIPVPASEHVCWRYQEPLGPAGTESNTCPGDSGGPLFADLGAGTTLVGVHSGGSIASCGPPSLSFDTDVYVNRTWIRNVAGVDLDETACGDGAQVGDPEVATVFFTGTAATQSTFHDFTIPEGVALVRVALTGENDASSDLDLYVGVGAVPSTSSFDCASTEPDFSIEYCELARPTAGDAHLLVRRIGAASDYQLTVTLLPEDPSPPPLAAGGIVVAGFASHELAQVDTVAGLRAVVSSDLRGTGPALSRPEGVAVDARGRVLVANMLERNLLRVDRVSGARSLVSGCADADCSSLRGEGPPLLGPRFVTAAPDGRWLVADRDFATATPNQNHFAIVSVDPASGDRVLVSGCSDAACSSVVGAGPAIGRLFGLVVEAAGTIVVADGQDAAPALLRIDPVTGDRTRFSGCVTAGCSSTVGSGHAFGSPVDVLLEPDGQLVVTYRIEGSAFGAIRRVDPVTGARTLISGCQNQACSSVRGSGPRFVDPFGVAREEAGTFLASDATLEAIVRVDPVSGARTLVSGCADTSCSSAAGSGPNLGEPVDLVIVPAPGSGAAAGAAALALAALSVARAGTDRPRRRSRCAGGARTCARTRR